MSTEPQPQREALEQSEKRASETQPENYKDAATADKVVEIPPIDGDSIPIQGLDPDDEVPRR